METAPAPGLPGRSSFKAKNLATTTWSIWTPPGSWYRSLNSRRWRSSSTAIPSGVAIAASVVEAYQKALATDPVSAFGSVIGVNREVDDALAEEIAKLFVEAIAAPSFSEEAKARLSAKKNLRLLVVKPAASRQGSQADFRRAAAAGRGCRRRRGGRTEGRDRAPADDRKKWSRFVLPGEWPSTSSPMPWSMPATARP